MEIKGRDVLIVGFGKTGEELCRFLLSQGAHVTVSEKRSIEQLPKKIDYWQQQGVVFEMGGHRTKTFLNAQLIIPSPGVPKIPELELAMANGVKILSEVEFAFPFLKGRVVGITGTNGKSTTATLSHKILKEGGINAFLAGNIGTPLISFVPESKDDHVYVTELSSFQLEYVQRFKACLSVLLNVSPDHLDWHGSFAHYFQAKKHLFAPQGAKDIAILNRDDPLVWDLRGTIRPKVYGFSRHHRVSPGCFIEQEWIVFADRAEERVIRTSDIPLPGVHNQENVMSSILIGLLFGIPASKLRETITGFYGLEHRLEEVATLRGVVFYNDSKATNVSATLKSLQSFNQKIVLILGGRDKGGDFGQLRKPVTEQVKKVILLGEAKEKIAGAIKNKNGVPMEFVSSLKEAVEKSFAAAAPGEIVLLAPGCTSFDMFHDFEERGRVFKHEVFALKEKIQAKGTQDSGNI